MKYFSISYEAEERERKEKYRIGLFSLEYIYIICM